MDDDLTSQPKVPRFASPSIGGRSPKRSRKTIEPLDMEQVPETLLDIIAAGDALVAVNGLSESEEETTVGLRVSSSVMSMASPVLKNLFAGSAARGENEPKIVVQLSGEDADAVFMLCSILHLRNDKLPSRVPADLLHKVALLAHQFQCTIAVGRATTQWFDRLYHSAESSHVSLCKTIEAAYMLNEAAYFARFTSRWMLRSSILSPQLPTMSTSETQKLALMLLSQQTSASTQLRTDLDALVDIAVRCFSREYSHYIDWAPEMSPDPSETPSGKQPVKCRVDGDGAGEFLGALRDAYIWPSGTWYRGGEDNVSMSENQANAVSVGEVVDRLADFTLPEYDDADRCEFCDRVRIEFASALKHVKQLQKERLWGLCLDCFKAGGCSENECRFEHAKGQQAKAQTPLQLHSQPRPQIQKQTQQAQQSAQKQSGGLGIEGL